MDAVYDIVKPQIAVWGFAFKSGTDDMRESPVMQIIEYLVLEGYKITGFDPKASSMAYEVKEQF